MIELFEDITYELTDQEKELIPLFVRGLKNKVGPSQAITSKRIMEKVPGLNGARIRKIINYIRVNYLLPGLMASSSGYYISRDPKEIRSYINSLGHREAAIATVRRRMEEYLKQMGG